MKGKKMYCRYIFVILVSSFALQATWVEYPSASELLDKYATTQDKLGSSFISKLEVSTKYEGVNRGRPNMKRGEVYTRNRRIEVRSDGERNYSCHQMWGKWPGFNSGEKYPTTSYSLWDGETSYQYGYYPLARVSKNGTATLSYMRPPKPNIKWQGMPASTLRGYFPGVSERIDTELRQATTISVEPQREDINGSKCYVINARTKGSEYRIWIDPEHEYNISKAIVKRAWASWSRPELYSKHPPDGSSETEVSNVRFKKINDIWMPVEADYREEHKYVNGDYEKLHAHFKNTEFVLNPDHDALGSFEPDFIREGAMVYVSGARGITYTWQNGEPIPNVDEAVIDQLDRITDEIMAETIRPKSVNAPIDPTVSGLLDKYTETQDKLRSFIAKGESTIEYIKIPNQSGRMQKERCEFRTDGDGVNHRSSLWDKLLSKDKALYKSFLWDGESFIQYRQGSQLTDSTVFIEKNDDSKKRMIATEYKGAPLMGICGGDYDRIDSILRKADNISLRQKTEQVGNSQCYVIDAVTKRGKYMVWIDPEHGYNITKIEVQRKKGDLIRSSERVKIGMLFLLENVRFEKIDGVWVPMEADMKQYQDDQIRIIKWHHKRTKMTLNPDHNALGSFVPDDIPEGAKVSPSNLCEPRTVYPHSCVVDLHCAMWFNEWCDDW